MSDDKADPLVSIEVDLRDFAFMPLDVLRLRDSDLSTLATGDEFKAAVLLWCTAWHQVPAGSVPSDERWLARHSGAGSGWKKVRAEALRGFVLCSDGRLYHQVVSAKARESWGKKQEQRAKTLKARIAGINKRLAEAVTAEEKEHLSGLLQTLSQSLSQAYSDSVTRSVTESVTTSNIRDSKGTVKGQVRDSEVKGEVNLNPKVNPASDAASASPAAEKPKRSNGKAKPEPPTRETWAAYASAYEQRYGVEPMRNAKVNGMMARFCERIPLGEAPQVAAFFVRSNRGLYVSAKHAVDLLLRDAEGLRTEWATGQHGTETQARQADQTAAAGNVWGKLISEAEEREKLDGKTHEAA